MNTLLTPDEVAERLRVDRRTVTDWLAAGTLPGFRIGEKLWRVDADALEDWLRSRSTARTEPEEQ